MADKKQRDWFVKNQYRPNFIILQSISYALGGKNFTPECINNCYRKAVDIVNRRHNTECLYDIPYGQGYIEANYTTVELLEMCYDLLEEE